MRSPIRILGGKGKMARWIVDRLPECEAYVEPFGGGASVLLAREPVRLEVYNDLDESLVGFFKVLADPALFGDFYRRVALLPYSRALFYECRRTWAEQADPVERAARWFVLARQNFGGMCDSWGFVVTAHGHVPPLTWASTLKMLPAIHCRLQRVQIECNDWRKVLAAYDGPDTLFYCDPPFVHATRSSTRYTHELSDQDHVELVERLLALDGKAAVSTYPNDIYRRLVAAGWKRQIRRTVCHAAGKVRESGLRGLGAATRMQPRTEWLLVKPERKTEA